jgi:cytohesin
MLKLLVINGVSLTEPDVVGQSIMFYTENANVIRYLHSQGIAINPKKPELSLTALHDQQNIDALAVMIELGADINARADKNITPLHWAIRNNQYDKIKWLMDAGADLNAQTTAGWTPLHYAVHHGNVNIVSELIYDKAKLSIRDNMGRTPLALAKQSRNQEMIEMLTAAGAK